MAARAPAESVNPLIWTGSTLKVLDQRCLPEHVEYREYASSHEVAEAISSMQVRGAPAIGIAAAYGAALSVLERAKTGGSEWKDAVQSDLDELARSRPTAVNLFWALERIEKVLEDASWSDAPTLIIREALDIHEQDRLANLKMGILGADLLEPNAGLLTHCNTGALATGGLGTALGVVRTAVSRSPRAVFATETRPWNQGARLTIWELSQDRIPATLIADSAASMLMRSGQVGWVIVGADRITANGDTANKIGTYQLAVAAKQHGLKFMVVAPTSTIDWSIESGEGIEIEERDAAELLPAIYREKNAEIDAWNPVFDVTPHAFIDVIVTEKGVVKKPSMETMQAVLR